MQILVVEDEHRLARNIQRVLISENYLVDLAYDGQQALEKLQNTYDLIILDHMIPHTDGLTLLKQIRQARNNTPVIMLTAKSTLDDKITGLKNGADDYLTKPFSFEELLARIETLIRRSTHSDLVLKIDNLTLNPSTKTVQRQGQPIKLSSTEYRLLEYLMRNQNHVLSENQLLEHVWDRNYDGLSNVVSVYIRYLRNKIDKPFPKAINLIQTIRGMGYKISEQKN